MNPGFLPLRTFTLRISLVAASVAVVAFASAQGPAKAVASDDVPAASRIEPHELVAAMKASGAQKPAILYVGPNAFYVQAHIPGAENIGPVGKPEGMEKLRARAATLPKDSPVVIYCGCCPWDHCPNIRPAFAELKKAGFTRVRVLYLATGLGPDWVDKGFPAAKGE